MFALIYLTIGFIFVAYGLFHLWQRGFLEERDIQRAWLQILLWPALVFMAIDVVVDKVIEDKKNAFARKALNG